MKLDLSDSNVQTIVGILVVALEIFAIWGAVYLFKFAWYSEKIDDKHCIKMSTMELNMVKLTSLLLMISILSTLGVFAFLSGMFLGNEE